MNIGKGLLAFRSGTDMFDGDILIRDPDDKYTLIRISDNKIFIHEHNMRKLNYTLEICSIDRWRKPYD